MLSRSWMACTPLHLKLWVGFHDHPHSHTDWKWFKWPLTVLLKGNEFRRPGGRSGHSTPCWFKNSISNLTQMRLLLRDTVSVKKQQCQTQFSKAELKTQNEQSLWKHERQLLLFQPAWKSLKQFNILTSWSISQSYYGKCIETYMEFVCLVFRNCSTKNLFGPWLIVVIKTLIIDLSFTFLKK